MAKCSCGHSHCKCKKTSSSSNNNNKSAPSAIVWDHQNNTWYNQSTRLWKYGDRWVASIPTNSEATGGWRTNAYAYAGNAEYTPRGASSNSYIITPSMLSALPSQDPQAMAAAAYPAPGMTDHMLAQNQEHAASLPPAPPAPIIATQSVAESDMSSFALGGNSESSMSPTSPKSKGGKLPFKGDGAGKKHKRDRSPGNGGGSSKTHGSKR